MPKHPLFRLHLNAKVTEHPSQYSSRRQHECSNYSFFIFYANGARFCFSLFFSPWLSPWHFGRSSQHSHPPFSLPLSRTLVLLQICTGMIWEPEQPPYQDSQEEHALFVVAVWYKRTIKYWHFLVWCLPKKKQTTKIPKNLLFFSNTFQIS